MGRGGRMLCRIALHYTQGMVKKPLLWQMARQFDVQFNIYRARVDEDEKGYMMLELEGDSRTIHQSIGFFEGQGLEVTLLDDGIDVFEEDQMVLRHEAFLRGLK